MKNLLALVVNAAATIYFIIFTTVSWSIVLFIALGTIIGSQIGARYGRKLPDVILRRCIVLIGLGVAIYLGILWR